jgi:hypothetical protein
MDGCHGVMRQRARAAHLRQDFMHVHPESMHVSAPIIHVYASTMHGFRLTVDVLQRHIIDPWRQCMCVGCTCILPPKPCMLCCSPCMFRVQTCMVIAKSCIDFATPCMVLAKTSTNCAAHRCSVRADVENPQKHPSYPHEHARFSRDRA